MFPPAPGRLSTITGCFQVSISFCPRARATVSTAPPAANGTTIRTGLAGYAWATAPVAVAAEASAMSALENDLTEVRCELLRGIIDRFPPGRKAHPAPPIAAIVVSQHISYAPVP